MAEHQSARMSKITNDRFFILKIQQIFQLPYFQLYVIRPCVQVLFDSVGGLSKHIRALKEMIVFPLLYPEIFVRFKIAPPRGVLFHGPPGTTVALADLLTCTHCLSCLSNSSASHSRQ